MTPQVRLQKAQIADLRVICDIEPSRFNKAVSAVADLPNAILFPDRIAFVLDGVLENEIAAEAILRQALSIHSALLHFNVNAREFLSALRQSLVKLEPPWEAEVLSRWDKNSAELERLIKLPILALSSKTLDLSYEHPELLQNARIITEIRPVFDESASKIQGAVVSHNLVLQYDDLEGDHALTLAMDESDLFSLMQQCERALKKAKTAKDQLQKDANIPTLIAGGDDE